MGMSVGGGGGLNSDPNVVPMIDIMLVLLIVFMLTAHLIAKRAIEVELPRASQGTAVKTTTLSITMKADGQIFLGDTPTSADALRAAVDAAVKVDPHTQVVIAGDKKVEYGRIVWVLDLVKSLKVTAFAIQIDPSVVVPPP